jgi:carboxyl-terminal processing protease
MRLSVILFLLFGLNFYGYAQSNMDAPAAVQRLYASMKEEHYKAPTLDDHFSEKVYEQLLNRLDPDRLYFSAQSLQPLEVFKSTLDEEWAGKSWKFVPALTRVFETSLQHSLTLLDQLQIPMDTIQKIELLEKRVEHNALLKNRIIQYIRYQTMASVADRVVEEQWSSDQFKAVWDASAAKVIRTLKRGIQRTLQHRDGLENFVAAQYLDAFCSEYDPHSSYLTPSSMEQLMGSLSTHDYYFGISMAQTERGDIAITALAPGGPAWRCGEIQVSDILVSVQLPGQDEIDFTDLSVDEADQILAEANHLDVLFTVRKKSGLVKKVTLRKEKLSSEENVVRSYVLHGTTKIGYINLPDFYTVWDAQDAGSRSSTDIAYTLLKLRKDNIGGLILDLRNNGGGALNEAIAIAGLFIDEGLMVILKNSKEKLTYIRDFNRGLSYGGPLVVLVNAQSASASELLSGVLQDYNRALIVGSQTYGKGSMQKIVQLDAASSRSKHQIPSTLGYVKITNEQFYRVTGAGIQGVGIKPDIVLPDWTSSITMKETDLVNALKSDFVNPTVSFKPWKSLALDSLRKKSARRVSADSSWQLMNTVDKWFKETMDKGNDHIKRSWQEIVADAYTANVIFKKLEHKGNDASNLFEVVTMKADQERLEMHDYSIAYNEHWIKYLQHDNYVKEAYLILTDILKPVD